MRRDVIDNDCTGTDNAPGSDRDLVLDRCPGADVRAFADRDVAADRCSRIDVDEIADRAVVRDRGFDVQDAVAAECRTASHHGSRRYAAAFADFIAVADVGGWMYQRPGG